MRYFKWFLLLLSLTVVTNSPAFAHIGKHQVGLYEAAKHFLLDPVHVWSVGVACIVVFVLRVYWLKVGKN